ncbi:hypothetical protein ACEE94_12005, partial [Staphylococcus epidermidis]
GKKLTFFFCLIFSYLNMIPMNNIFGILQLFNLQKGKLTKNKNQLFIKSNENASDQCFINLA